MLNAITFKTPMKAKEMEIGKEYVLSMRGNGYSDGAIAKREDKAIVSFKQFWNFENPTEEELKKYYYDEKYNVYFSRDAKLNRFIKMNQDALKLDEINKDLEETSLFCLYDTFLDLHLCFEGDVFPTKEDLDLI
ncbi:hypothetical protein U8V72_14465 [Priestia filamentosa]|uniref:hypothetical protein n=1 Tax=Priestia filamentosa TaxID=1402861 RepID=UPI000588FE0A